MNNFTNKLLLTNTQVPRVRKAFKNGSSANIKLSKTQLYKIGQSKGFLDRLSRPLVKIGLLLMKNKLKLLAKSALIPLGLLLLAAAATGTAIHKKMIGSGTRTVIISIEEINDIMKMVKSLDQSGLLITGKCTIRAGEGTIRAGQDFLMPPDPLTNFEIQKYNQNKLKFDGIYSRSNLPKTKDGAYVINLDERKSMETHWIALYVNGHNRRASYNAINFDGVEIEHIPKNIKTFLENKNMIAIIYRILAYDAIMCGYFCVGFIDFMLKGKSLLDYTNLFSPIEE